MKLFIGNSTYLKFSIEVDGGEASRGRLYVIENDLHDKPYGLVEDVYTQKEFQGLGYANQIMDAIEAKARELGLYKLVACSRKGKQRARVHDWYIRRGFRRYGHEFRMNLK